MRNTNTYVLKITPCDSICDSLDIWKQPRKVHFCVLLQTTTPNHGLVLKLSLLSTK